MKILSLSVGQPRDVTWDGKTVKTAFLKEPVDGPLRATRLGFEGDAQADLKHHGGPDQAIYFYPREHYPFWQRVLSVDQLAWGSLGENCTISGLLEDEVRLGDLFRVGSAQLRVTLPRIPCAKLNLCHRTLGLVEHCLESGHCGFYCAVPEEGLIAVGDEIELLERHREAPTIAEVFRAISAKNPDLDVLRRAIRVDSLPDSWKKKFRIRLI